MKDTVTMFLSCVLCMCCAAGGAEPHGGTKDPAAKKNLVFRDRFKKKLAPGWKWLREHKETWRFGEKGLEICVEPGVAHNVKNALVRPAPDRGKGAYAIEVTVSNHTVPIQQYEQAGITWYHKGKPVFKLVKECIDGKLYIIPGKKPMPEKRVRLRLIVTADSWVAQYQPGVKGEFKTAAKGKLPPPEKDQVSIQCYNGPPGKEHWIRFEDFQIRKLPDAKKN